MFSNKFKTCDCIFKCSFPKLYPSSLSFKRGIVCLSGSKEPLKLKLVFLLICDSNFLYKLKISQK